MSLLLLGDNFDLTSLVCRCLQATQAALLGAASAQQLAMEKLLYDNMAAQAAADAKAKVCQRFERLYWLHLSWAG